MWVHILGLREMHCFGFSFHLRFESKINEIESANAIKLGERYPQCSFRYQGKKKIKNERRYVEYFKLKKKITAESEAIRYFC